MVVDVVCAWLWVVVWTTEDPEYDGGSSVSEYLVTMNSGMSGARDVYRGHDTQCTVASLLPGRLYTFQVKASNKAGVCVSTVLNLCCFRCSVNLSLHFFDALDWALWTAYVKSCTTNLRCLVWVNPSPHNFHWHMAAECVNHSAMRSGLPIIIRIINICFCFYMGTFWVWLTVLKIRSQWVNVVFFSCCWYEGWLANFSLVLLGLVAMAPGGHWTAWTSCSYANAWRHWCAVTVGTVLRSATDVNRSRCSWCASRTRHPLQVADRCSDRVAGAGL